MFCPRNPSVSGSCAAPARYERAPDKPWPTWPRIFWVDYSPEEVAAKSDRDPWVCSISWKSFMKSGDGLPGGIFNVEVELKDGRFAERPDTEREWKADLVLLSMGFLGAEHEVSDSLAIEYDRRSNYAAEYGRYITNAGGVFAACGCRRRQFLVVHAINESRGAARANDRSLMARAGCRDERGRRDAARGGVQGSAFVLEVEIDVHGHVRHANDLDARLARSVEDDVRALPKAAKPR